MWGIGDRIRWTNAMGPAVACAGRKGQTVGEKVVRMVESTRLEVGVSWAGCRHLSPQWAWLLGFHLAASPAWGYGPPTPQASLLERVLSTTHTASVALTSFLAMSLLVRSEN